jgi:single-strand DNA-binding protein
MQQIQFIGNLCNDPELRQTNTGTQVCSFSVAVNRRFKDKDGNTATDFFRVTAWRGLAENCSKYLAKGRKVYVRGELQVWEYTAKDGAVKFSMDVQADEVEFLTPKSEAEAQKPKPNEEDFTDVNPLTLPF